MQYYEHAGILLYARIHTVDNSSMLEQLSFCILCGSLMTFFLAKSDNIFQEGKMQAKLLASGALSLKGDYACAKSDTTCAKDDSPLQLVLFVKIFLIHFTSKKYFVAFCFPWGNTMNFEWSLQFLMSIGRCIRISAHRKGKIL